MKPPVSGISSRARLFFGAAFAAAAALGVYATLVEPRLLRVDRRTIHVRGLPRALEGLRIAHLTDLHAGRMTPWSVIRRAVAAARREAPEIVVITGDLIDRRAADLDRALDLATGLRAPLGVFAVPGNHDRAHTSADHWRRALDAHPGVRDVTNRYEMVERDGARVCIAGVDDLEAGHPHLSLPHASERDLTILLAHNPDHAERTRREGDIVDLVVSGHTHGGQVRVPPFGAVHRKSQRYDQGLRRRPWTQVYTSRGVGNTFLPIRFAAPPELAILQLTGEPRRRW